MHKSEIRVNLILITRTNKVYKLKAETTKTQKITRSLKI